MSTSSEDEVFSENEGKSQNATYVKTDSKQGPSNGKSQSTHPPYFDMVEHAIKEMAGTKGVSKSKIVKYIEDTYSIEASNLHIIKALKKGIANELFENKTGSGANGSFKLTKSHKETLNRVEKAKAKLEKVKEKKKNEEENDENQKPKKSQPEKKSKDDMELLKQKKKPPPAPKGKSASQKPTKGSQKVLKEKVKTLKKASSMGDMKKKISKAVPADESEKENQPKKKTKK